MSLILDALKRSHRERESLRDPDTGLSPEPFALEDDANHRAAGAEIRLVRWLILAVGVLVVIVGTLIWRMKDGGPPSGDVAVVAAVSEAPAAGKQAGAPGEGAGGEIAGVRHQTSAPAPEASLAEVPQDRVPQDRVPQDEDREEARAIAALYRQREQEPAAVQPPQASGQKSVNAEEESEAPSGVDLAAAITRARQQVEATALRQHDAPLVVDLPAEVRDAIPTILYRQHDYRYDHPEQSSVNLNGRDCRVGAVLEGGIKLEEILPESIVLRRGDTQFRLRALNSWVNL